MDASLPRAAARGLAGSIWRRSWPRLTRSPSFTAMWVTWPAMVAEMSTLRWACTFPLAVTLAWRSSRATAAVCTSVGSGPRWVANQPPVARITTARARSHQRFRFNRPFP